PMRRRELIMLVGSAGGGAAFVQRLRLAGRGATSSRCLAARWPGGRSGRMAMPVIGFLTRGSRGSHGPLAAAFRRGLAENGFIEGQNGLRHVAFQDDYRLTFASLLHQGTCANQLVAEIDCPTKS